MPAIRLFLILTHMHLEEAHAARGISVDGIFYILQLTLAIE
jgi:hypothetical protein